MSTALAILALVLWIVLPFEAENPGIVRRVISLPFALLMFLAAWFFQVVSGWRIDISWEAPNSSSEPTRILYEDLQP